MEEYVVCIQVGRLPSDTKICDQMVWVLLIGQYLNHSDKNVQINRAGKKK